MPSYLSPGVYIEEVPSGSMPLSAAGTAVAAFVGFTAKTPTDDPRDPKGLRPRLVTNWSQYKESYGGFTKSALLPLSVRGFFANGGGRCYIVPIPHRMPNPMEIASGDADQKLTFQNYTDDDELEVTITPTPAPDPDKVKTMPKPTFTVSVKKKSQGDAGDDSDRFDEVFPSLTLGSEGRNVAAVINRESDLIQVVSTFDDEDKELAEGTFDLGKQEVRPVGDLETDDFGGSAEERTGVDGLAIADDVTMVMVPDLITAVFGPEKATAMLTGKGDVLWANWGEDQQLLWKGVQQAVAEHCESHKNRMAILDPPPGLNAKRMQDFSDEVGYDYKFATMYYPWLKVDNPAGAKGDKYMYVPPCGHMGGIWAQTDDTRGVWKAPANVGVADALDVQDEINKLEHDGLNPIGINVIRSFKGRGLKVWGARTLSKTDPSWRYINVRRLFNMVETSIMDGTQWVVFEPNDQALWQRVKRTVDSFLLGLWRDGALFGASAAEAFFVKCDAETNPPESIDEGKLIIEVGIAPVKPAEFVIFRISQKTSTSTA